MDNGNGMSVADVAALSGGGFGGFGNGFEGLIYLAVIASMFGGGWGGFGGWGNGSAGAAIAGNFATQADIQRGFDYSNLLDGNRDLSNLITSGTAQAVAATNATFHDTLNVLNDKYSELQRDVASLAVGQANALANQNQCCCESKMLIAETGAGINAGIAQSRYDNAMNTAGINANIAESRYENAMALAGLEQRITSKLDQNKIEALQAQVSELQLAQATAGMLRFPNSWSYGAGPFPPIFGGCCGNGNI